MVARDTVATWQVDLFFRSSGTFYLFYFILKNIHFVYTNWIFICPTQSFVWLVCSCVLHVWFVYKFCVLLHPALSMSCVMTCFGAAAPLLVSSNLVYGLYRQPSLCILFQVCAYHTVYTIMFVIVCLQTLFVYLDGCDFAAVITLVVHVIPTGTMLCIPVFCSCSVMLCIPVFCSCSTSSVQAHWTTYCCARTCATGRRVCRSDITCHILSSGSETNECRSDIICNLVWIWLAVRDCISWKWWCWGFRSSEIWRYGIGWVVPDARIVVHLSSKSSSERKIFFNCLNLKIKSLWPFRMSAMPSQATHYHIPEDLDLALYNPAEPFSSPHQTLRVADVQHWTCCRKRMCRTHCSLSSRLLSCCRLGRQMKMCRVSVICVTSCLCSR